MTGREILDFTRKSQKVKQLIGRFIKDETLTISERFELVQFRNRVDIYLLDKEKAPLLRKYIDEKCEDKGRGTTITYEDAIDFYVGNGELLYDENSERIEMTDEEYNKKVEKFENDMMLESIQHGYFGCQLDW